MLQTTILRDAMRAAIGVPASAMVATIIARVTEQKGHAVLFDALASTPELRALHLVIVGDGPLRAPLEARARPRRPGRPRPFPRRAARPRRSARGVGHVRAAVAVGRTAALARAGDGRGAAGRQHHGCRDSGSRARRRNRPARAARRRDGARPRDRARRRLVRRALGLGAAARAFVLPRFGVDTYVSSITTLYERLLAKEAA